VSEVRTARRYYLLNRRAAALTQSNLEQVWQGLQENEPGTPFPAGFPKQQALIALGYEALEDLDGADEDELTEAGLSWTDAQAVLKAFARI